MTPYDAVRYPTAPKEQTHPDRLASIAMIYGLAPAPVERCRVLEIGCGTGYNLIPMAYTLPRSEFTGIDLAERPIEEGRRRAAALGLANVRLCAMNMMDVTPAFGEFDYIVAHGVYSWVPAEVRDKLLEICRANLAPQGVAFVSYNAYPGCHLRRMARDMMLYHTAGVEDPEERIRQARSLVSLLVEAQTDPGMAAEFRVVLERDPSVIYHDDLAEFNHPVYFHEFIDHARRHDLQFLCESNLVAPDGRLPEKVRKALEPLDADPVRKEQYLDFMKVRRFRETLLCRAEAAVARPVPPERVRGLYASSKASPAGAEEPGGAVEFVGDNGALAKTAHPLAKACLALLGRAWPRRFAFDEILREVCDAAGEHESGALAEILWYTCRAGLVELHAHRGCFAARAGEYPVASALARHDLREGTLTATLAHGVVQIEDPVGRRLVEALDGTRNRGALALQLDAPLDAIEGSLARLARLPLLLG